MRVIFWPATVAGILLVFSPTPATSQHRQLFDDPQAYFGGVNHQSYLSWMAENSITDRYAASTFLPAKSGELADGAALHWKVVGDELHVAMAARAQGWLAFGITQAGGMLGSDIVYWELAAPETLTDAHVEETRNPLPDDCGQDWTFVASDTTREGFVMWEGKRLLQTGDTQDHDIIPDATDFIPAHRVIAAWGDEESMGYHDKNVARGVLRFHQTAADRVDFASLMKEKATTSFSIRASDYTIKPVDTEYKEFCFSKADIIKQGIPDQPLQGCNGRIRTPRICSGAPSHDICGED